MDPKQLLVLFQHPGVPSFSLTQKNGNAVLKVPNDYITDEYKDVNFSNRFDDDKTVSVGKLPAPDIAFAEVIKRTEGFSLFVRSHREIAGKLISLFVKQPSVEALLSAATYARDRLNKYLFQYAFTVAINHRPDTKNIDVPSFLQVFPEQFVDPIALNTMREQASVLDAGSRTVVDIPVNYTATNLELEQRVAYFREDIGINLHHWHWHLVYPGDAGPGNDAIVRKDRRGELFYYMHSQVQARYNVDRFAHGLGRVRSWSNFRENIAEAYFPKILRSANNRTYPPRTENMAIRDLNRTDNGTIVTVNEVERMRDRIVQAINQEYVINTAGQRINLDEKLGIDYLGDIIEASTISINPTLYGNLHNEGHNLIAYAHDPLNKYLEDFAVIGDVTTAMRDPAFYKLHGYLDDIFEMHKEKLPRYNAQHLAYDGIVVNSMSIQTNKAKVAGTLLTYWQKTTVDLAAGLDFGPQGNILASFTHLQHAPFTYNINVTNRTNTTQRGTCRIFIGPKVNERGQALTFKEQRGLMIELDKFTVILKTGENKITRRSEQSSITIPFERTFRAVGAAQQTGTAAQLAEFRFCGCGWPQHMLLPKGTAAGFNFDTYVMISNYKDDFVVDYDQQTNCGEAHSFCGLLDQKYPDKRSMGYPFDRLISENSLQQFVTPYPNMKVGAVTIKFQDTYVTPSSDTPARPPSGV